MTEWLTKAWFRGLYSFIAKIAFNKVAEATPQATVDGPVIYAALHRNGALDGAVYQQIIPSAKLTLASQLRRNKLMRVVFDGIEILRSKDRTKDGSRVSNAASFKFCAEYLAGDGHLLFFPEGTSELGAQHLPFKSGVAVLVEEVLKMAPKVTVVPVAAHYENATEWQSRVEIEFGTPIVFTTWEGQEQVMEQIAAGLEVVGLDCANMLERQEVEALAYAATLGNPDITYSAALHALQKERPSGLPLLQKSAQREGLALHQGIPLVPMQAWPIYALAWVAMAPLVAFALAANLPVLIGANKVAKRFADAPNVVALWRTLGGLGLWLIWTPLVIGTLASMFGVIVAAVWMALSMVGIRLVYRFRKLSIALFNLFRASAEVSAQLKALHAELGGFVRSKVLKR